MIVRVDLETDAVAGAQNKASCYRLAAVTVALVNLGCLQAQAAGVFSGKNQVTAAQFEFVCAVELEFGLRWLGAGGHLEIVFQLALVSVENQIDSGIDTRVVNSGKLRNAAVPLARVITDDVVAFARQRIGSVSGCGRIGADQLHADKLFAASRWRL